MLYVLLLVYCYFLFVNLGAFSAVGYDKYCARRERRRVPELTLLGLAAAGGWLGGRLGQKMFRHKTRKEGFVQIMNAIPMLHLVLAAAALLSLGAITT